MSLEDYKVRRDKFEPEVRDPMLGLCFPCSACKHKRKTHKDRPCMTCDHNTFAVKDEEPKETT